MAPPPFRTLSFVSYHIKYSKHMYNSSNKNKQKKTYFYFQIARVLLRTCIFVYAVVDVEMDSSAD